MRKSKIKSKTIKSHTSTERLALRRFQRKFGPSAMKRKKRRLSLQSKGFQGVELNVEMMDELHEPSKEEEIYQEERYEADKVK